MLKNTYCFLIAIFAFQFVSAQVKIGSNPNTIDAASIMELESNDKALVLTRLSNAEMTALTPLRGALVYNTDSQCIYFYDSTQWINLCNSTNTTGFSFTDNGDGTITLVNDIGGTLTFNGAPETISTLEDNLDGTFTYTDENGIATTISGASSQSLTTDGTAGNVGIADGNTIILNVDDADADNQNELQNLQFSGGLISLTDDPDATIIDISGISTNATNIATNTTDIDNLETEQTIQNDAIALNTVKVGITAAQADIIANTSGVNTGDQDISGIAINATDIDNLEAEQTTQNDAIALNTSKVGITTAQVDIIANTSGVNTGDQDISGIAINATDINNLEAEQITQNDAIALNTAKVGITTAQADIIANTSGVNTGDQDISGIAINATDIDNLEAEQTTQNDAIAINTAKVGITTAQADIIANTSGVNTGDQDISGIAINATDIDNLEIEQTTQNDAIALNTAKVGITTAQADIIANTSGVNTGDQDISGIAINETDIDNLEAEQTTQNDAIALNTAKVGITTTQADIIANTSGVNTGDQDISGIAINATDIDNLEAEQTTQNDAIALNTAKVGITTAQADIIANTAGVNTGDQDISGIAINATDIDNLETEQTTQNTNITTNATDIDNLEIEQITQNDAIAINTAKVGITTAQADIIANTSGVNTGDQDISGIAINATDIDNLEAEQTTQNDAIALNTAKVGITTVQADIIANTSGVNTGDQDISGIAINATNIDNLESEQTTQNTNIATNATDIDNLESEQITQNDAIALNTAKVGITTTQADIIANTSGVNTGDQDISGIAINAADIDNLEAEQTTQNDAIAINTAKVGITTAQADIIANTSGVNTGDQDISGIAINATDIDNLETEQVTQNNAITLNTAKVGITTVQADIIANTSGVNTGDQDISGIAINATDIDNLEAEQITQNDAIALNTAKVGITTVQADIIANTSGVNTGDQDISGIAINATDIDNLEAEQTTQNDAIAINTAKVGITTTQADIIANTSGVNTGDQDISGIAINATDIDNLEAEQTTQNDAIALNTAKVGITTTQADIIANTSGVNTGDQDISGIAINVTDIDNLETEQTTQNDAIAINTAKVGITTAQADIIANTSGVNTGDQDISGIAINATDIDNLETEQVTQNTNIVTNATDIDNLETEQVTQNTNIATNATDIDNLETEQITQNDAIALNTTNVTNNTDAITAHNIADEDLSTTNEIQTLSISGSDLSISGTGGNTVPLPIQTNTTLNQDLSTGQISYVNEASVTQTANTVGDELNNSITPGTNGGAFYVSPIKAFGKIASGGGVTKATTGVTSTRLSTGRYRVSLPAGTVSDADYIIQLTQPGRGGAGNDDPGISYSNQTATSFEVIIGDNDNGGTDRSRFDSEFMFTILDL